MQKKTHTPLAGKQVACAFPRVASTGRQLAETEMPPVNPWFRAKKLSRWLVVSPSKRPTDGPPPGPAPVTKFAPVALLDEPGFQAVLEFEAGMVGAQGDLHGSIVASNERLATQRSQRIAKENQRSMNLVPWPAFGT